ncbi:MAG: LysR family transcriptional regulator [Paraglaciecola sp.]|uniref:LysR family transcriptional regulator n=1 Tax=Paraglaciecola sp. TaxID=1920173 RepID=UPI00273DE567|nr:LysR family transcriptional regulator [Paraglaciecola sp.]MDP5032301.1 LysR family transcriptional regulator [Paraglaciecola sp.]MDP5130020.1 LysR family transcriptional regulator [Paraglaciecola sp.]|tara:strand:- start:1300 stop:2196 length:897 start_codon:yes stop_codon:yes gene_type:complete
MTLEQIKMFVTVAQLGSISAAAKVLHKTQPAISIALKRLQDELKLELLHREQYRLSLTDAGQKLLRHFEFLLKQQVHIDAIAVHLASGLERKVELVYETISHSLPIFNAVSEVQQRFPLTEFYLSSESNLGAIKRLIEGKGDIAISPWIDRFYELADFDTLPFSRFEIITVIHKNALPLKEQVPRFVSEIDHLPLLKPQTVLFDLDLDGLFGYVAPSQVRTNDLWAQKSMLLSASGWGYIPKHLVENELATGELIQLNLEDINFDAKGESRIVKLANHNLGVTGLDLWKTLAKLSTAG